MAKGKQKNLYNIYHRHRLIYNIRNLRNIEILKGKKGQNLIEIWAKKQTVHTHAKYGDGP